jgi:hypothetical protein
MRLDEPSIQGFDQHTYKMNSKTKLLRLRLNLSLKANVTLQDSLNVLLIQILGRQEVLCWLELDAHINHDTCERALESACHESNACVISKLEWEVYKCSEDLLEFG